jgi:hypothetical protein
LTRLLLSGTIKAGVAANLIFDMHSEYASERLVGRWRFRRRSAQNLWFKCADLHP